ncbi:MAG TPA: hypothetical protein VG826_32525, partial [Pirellulales bacterium]|nr:hypothetical protein [Pirellulales bacterium]
QPNDNLCLRRLPGDQFLGNPIERHTQGVAQIADCAKTSFSPPCERLHLRQVNAPTLLIVGGRDHAVLELNRQAFLLLRCPKKLVVVPDATHLFPEPGTLEEVAEHAARWFCAYLGPEAGSVRGRAESKAT